MAKLEVVLSEPCKLDPSTFIVPPDWAVRLVSKNFGKAGKPYPTHWYHNTYPSHYCGDEGYEETWYHAFGRVRTTVENKDDVHLKGNLKEEQYRFWNGSGVATSNIATCRWCRHWAYGQEEMSAHQDATEHTQILRAIYDFARSKQPFVCFACNTRTSHERWGIPMCATNKCRNKWRTAVITEISQTLHIYAKLAFSKGLLSEWLNEDRSEKHNTEARAKAFNWDSGRGY